MATCTGRHVLQYGAGGFQLELLAAEFIPGLRRERLAPRQQ